MKQVKDLRITTKEGFSVKNLQRFPSMEYGEDGGLQADLYCNGDFLMTVFDAGDGGCAIAHDGYLPCGGVDGGHSGVRRQISDFTIARVRQGVDKWVVAEGLTHAGGGEADRGGLLRRRSGGWSGG